MLPLILGAAGAALLLSSCASRKEEEETASSPSGDTSSSPKPTGLQYADSYTVDGELQTLFSADDSLWAISRFAGSYGVDERFDVHKITGNDYETVLSLPSPAQRSYSWTGPVQNGGEEIIASLYTSNAAFSPQDGTRHGVVFFDADGNLIADHDLYGTHGVTGPSGFAVD